MQMLFDKQMYPDPQQVEYVPEWQAVSPEACAPLG